MRPSRDVTKNLEIGPPLIGQSFAPGGGTKWYSFGITEIDVYQIDVTSESSDPMVDLCGPDDVLHLVDSDDDGGEGYDSRLRATLRPGEYYLGVREVEDEEGRFNVEVRRVEMPKPDDMMILAIGAPLTEQAFAPGGEIGWYRFTVTDVNAYQIDVTSESRDPAISLYGPDDAWELVGSNDDGGEETDSRLLVRLRPGEYCLEVVEVEGEPGNFDVHVQVWNPILPEEMKTCAENFKSIYHAIKQYEEDKGKLPDWLSDLVPSYLSNEALFCPNDPNHLARYSPDPNLPCSYSWEFSATLVPPGWDRTGRILNRDWKRHQLKVFGDIVPMVRCTHHRLVLNLARSGQIWWSPLDWEYMIKPNYRFSPDELRRDN